MELGTNASGDEVLRESPIPDLVGSEGWICSVEAGYRVRVHELDESDVSLAVRGASQAVSWPEELYPLDLAANYAAATVSCTVGVEQRRLAVSLIGIPSEGVTGVIDAQFRRRIGEPVRVADSQTLVAIVVDTASRVRAREGCMEQSLTAPAVPSSLQPKPLDTSGRVCGWIDRDSLPGLDDAPFPLWDLRSDSGSKEVCIVTSIPESREIDRERVEPIGYIGFTVVRGSLAELAREFIPGPHRSFDIECRGDPVSFDVSYNAYAEGPGDIPTEEQRLDLLRSLATQWAQREGCPAPAG